MWTRMKMRNFWKLWFSGRLISLPPATLPCSHRKDLRKRNQCDISPSVLCNQGLLNKGKDCIRAYPSWEKDIPYLPAYSCLPVLPKKGNKSYTMKKIIVKVTDLRQNHSSDCRMCHLMSSLPPHQQSFSITIVDCSSKSCKTQTIPVEDT